MYVDLELDKPRRLRFTLSAVKDLETAMGGKPLGGILDELGQLGINAVCVALICGLKHEDPTLTPNLMVKILSDYLERGGTLDTVYGAVKEALDGSGLFRTKNDPVPEGNAKPEPAAAG